MIAAGLTSVHSASQGHWRPLKVLGILNEFPQVPVPGGVQVQLGDAYGDERSRVVFELHIPGLASLGVAKVAEVVLRHVSVGGDRRPRADHPPHREPGERRRGRRRLA